MNHLTRKQVADAAGITIETVRFYEKEALILEPPRTKVGYRQYPVETIDRIRFIKRAQSLGFSLPEIKELLALRIAPQTTSADIRHHAQRKLEAINAKIQDLLAIRQALEKITEACHGEGPASDCPILDALEQAPTHEGEFTDDQTGTLL